MNDIRKSFREEFKDIDDIADDIWYVAVNDGQAMVKSHDLVLIEDYCDIKNEEGAEESAREYDYDIGSDASYWQNGYDGGFYDVGKVIMTPKGELLLVTRNDGDYDITKEELEDVKEITEENDF